VAGMNENRIEYSRPAVLGIGWRQSNLPAWARDSVPDQIQCPWRPLKVVVQLSREFVAISSVTGIYEHRIRVRRGGYEQFREQVPSRSQNHYH